MDHLIGPFQSFFIDGRQILDGALVISELLNSCKRKKVKATILKLVFHKRSIASRGISWIGLLSKWGFQHRSEIG